jgi:prevent-host-death family protein
MIAARPRLVHLTNLVTLLDSCEMRRRIVNVAEAKASLPELIERAANGEEIILARAGRPRAKLVPIGPDPKRLRIPGKGHGRFRVKRGFDAPLPDDVLELFEG